jgi:type I restriction enzyme, S subunit
MKEDWIEVVSGEILDIRDGTHDTPKYISEQAYPLVTSKNLKNGVIDFSNIKYISEQDFSEINKRSKVDIGDVLFAMIGTIGNPVLVKMEPHYSIKNIGLFKNPLKIIKSELLKYYLDSLNFYSQLEERQFLKGTTQKFIPLGHLRNIYIPLAPLPIQRAIVSKIEALFSDLDNGIANFKKAQEQLKIYRQAVLKKAFEGGFSITNEENQSSDNLPKGWKCVKVSDVCDMKAGYFIKADEINSEFENGLFPCYGGNGLRGYVKSTTHEGLFPIVGRQGALCGNVHLVNGKFHATEHAVVVSAKKEIDIKCLYYKLIVMKINQYATGTAQPGLSVNKILPIEIIYPSSLQEQTQIVQEIESRLSVCDKVEQSINESIEKAEALRQSILKKAFEGKLLSQAEIELCKKETDYEPASELLKKIKAEKLAKEQEKKKPITKKKGKK